MRNFVLVDAKTGKVYYPPDVRGGVVESAVTDGRGGWYIAGNFTRVGKVKRPGLAHLNPDGTLDRAFMPDLPEGTAPGGFNATFGANSVFAAGGSSSRAGAVVFALDGRTGRRRWSTWKSGAPLSFGNGVLYVGGYSDKIVAALDPKTGKPTAWKVRGWSSEPLVSVITVANGAVYLGGEFKKVGGVPVPCSIAAVSAKTGKVIWVPRKINACSTDFEINSLVVSHGQVLTRIVHDFSSARFVSIDVKTGKILPWSNEIGDADPLAASGDTVYLGASGGFSNVGKARVNNLAAITLPSGTLQDWSPNLGKCVSVGAAAVSGQKVLIAGHFAPRTCKA
ncbi:MAG: PQQ-binding-like beta-propeller repeat protein [Gaiellaceae bacterium]